MSPMGLRLLNLAGGVTGENEVNGKPTTSSSGTTTNSNSSGNGNNSNSPTQSSDFFTQGITRTRIRPDLYYSASGSRSNGTANNTTNNGPTNWNKENSESSSKEKFNSFFLWDKSKSQRSPESNSSSTGGAGVSPTSQNGTSPDANANNVNYEGIGTFSPFLQKDKEELFLGQKSSTLASSSSSLYEKAVNFANEVWTWNRKKFSSTTASSSPLWSLLLTYPSDLHWVGRTAIIAAVSGIVVSKTLEDLVSSVEFVEFTSHLEKALLDKSNFLDGTDPNDPGRVGINKDFL